MWNKKAYLLLPAFCFLFSFVFFSCRTFRDKKNIPEPLNYSDEDIIRTETERINSFMESEPVRALWRASLLGKDEVLERAKTVVANCMERAVEEKNYIDAKKYYKSLLAVDPQWKSEKYTFNEIEKLASADIPGLSAGNTKVPSNIPDCVNATVTVWVDRGVKVQNGAGYADIVIGSGFFIDERGYIVTNYHVIDSMVNPKYEGYSRLYIKLMQDSNTKIPAKVIGYDKLIDLALLKVEIEPSFVLNLGASSDLEVGDKISVIGAPVGLEGSLSSGVISSDKNRKFLALGNVFQIDAAVNSGNSGGPLVDKNLKVQAIVFAGFLQFQGLNFAIPVEYLKQELPVLYSHGEVVHPWLCAFGDTKREGGKAKGLEVQYVLPGGSAFMSGLLPGDVITQLDGIRISSIDDFNFIMMNYEIETLLECRYVNSENEEKSCLVYLEKRPEHPSLTVYKTDLISNALIPLLGMGLVSSSTTNRNYYTINRVLTGSTADDMHFSAGDEIRIVNIAIDQKNEFIYIQMYTKRKKQAFLDMGMGLASSFDSPYYF